MTTRVTEADRPHDPQPSLLRFDRTTRVVHWVTAALAIVVLVTGTILYVDQLSAMIGRRAFLKTVHVWCGLALPVPLVVGLVLGALGRGLRADIADLGRWTASDRRWLRKATRTTPAGKFNGGQKLATALFGGLFVMQLVTGSVMFWHNPFRDSWRTGATYVHDWVYIALLVMVLGHVRKAIQEPVLLRSMRTGRVPRAWASRERPGWAAEAVACAPDERS
jgi:formate dehydrogenase subunit gamma